MVSQFSITYPTRSLSSGGRRRLFEAQQEILLQSRRLRRCDPPEASRLDFLAEDVLARAHVLQNKLSALAFHPVKFDHDELAAGPQGLADRSKRFLRFLQVMIHVAEEDQVD